MKQIPSLVICTLLSMASTLSHGQCTSVAGDSNITIGQITADRISVIVNSCQIAELKAPQSSEIIKRLKQIQRQLNQTSGRLAGTTRDDLIGIGVVESFFATIKGKKIPPSAWAQEFAQLTRIYLQLGDDTKAVQTTSNLINAEIERAEAARQQDLFEQAEAVLAEASRLSFEEMQQKQAQTQAATRQTVDLYAKRAHLALSQLKRPQAAELLEQGFRLQEDAPNRLSHHWLIFAGDMWNEEGNGSAALRIFNLALTVATKATIQTPTNTSWQYGKLISLRKIGSTLARDGNMAAALKNFQASLDIAKHLTTENPDSPWFKSDLAISYCLTGNLQAKLGDTVAGLDNCQLGLDVLKHLPELTADDPLYQHEFSLIQGIIGDIQAEQGNTAPALQSYQTALKMSEGLADRDPDNLDLQHNLVQSHLNIGRICVKQNGWTRAFESYQTALKISKRLATLDPNNSYSLSRLFVSHLESGNIQDELGDTAGALENYKSALDISKRLAALAPFNIRWQLDVAGTYWNLANLKGDLTAAGDRQVWLQHGLEILNSLQAGGHLQAADTIWVSRFTHALQALH